MLCFFTIMPTAQRYFACFLAAWLLLVPFRTTVWQHLCFASGKAVVSLFEPEYDPCNTSETAPSAKAAGACCAASTNSKQHKAAIAEKPACADQGVSSNCAQFAADFQHFVPEHGGDHHHIAPEYGGCCKTDAQILGFDSDRIGKYDLLSDYDHAPDLWATIAVVLYRNSGQTNYLAYVPAPALRLPWANAPPLPYNRQKLNWIQIYRC